MHFTCTHCNWVATTDHALFNYNLAISHTNETFHSVVDENRYALQLDPARHGIGA